MNNIQLKHPESAPLLPFYIHHDLSSENKIVYKINSRNRVNGAKLLKFLKDNSITATFFDPQYRGILDKMNYGNEGKRQIKRSALKQMDEQTIINFIKEINRVLKKSGHLFLWIDKFHLCEGIGNWISDTDLYIVDMITWDKERMGMGYRTRRQSEYCIVLQKKPKRAKGIWMNHSIPDVWKEKIKNKIHPHQKPTGLISKLISAISKPKDIILDPCAGSYKVLEVCKELDRCFIGADIR